MYGEYLDCKMLSVMMKHLNSLNYFTLGTGFLWTQTIHVVIQKCNAADMMLCFRSISLVFQIQTTSVFVNKSSNSTVVAIAELP